MDNIGVTLKGIEDIAEKELKGKKVLERRIKFKGKIKNFKSVVKVYSLMKQFKFKELNEIIKSIEKLKFNFKGSVKVDCNREGNHEFRSVDVESGVYGIFGKRGFKIDYKKGKNIIYIDIFEDNCFVGILKKDEMQKREYRVRSNNKSISACLAFALLKLADYKKSDVLIDPFCKDGIIAIEAALLGGKKIFANDIDKNNLRNALVNAKMAKADKGIKFENYDIDWLDTKFKKESVNKIVSNIPSISKRSDKKDIEDIDRDIKELFNHGRYILKKNGKIVLISMKDDLIKKYSKIYGFKIIEERKVYMGQAEHSVFCFVK